MYDAPAMASKVGSTLCIGGLVLATARDPEPAQAALVPTAVPSPAAAGKLAKPRLEITTIAAPEAEDGRGTRVVAPPAPRALDVYAEGWPGRALDPVLHVGELRFHHYTFPAKGVMRFVVDDVARLRDGDEAALQWGDDAKTRVVLTRSLEVPR
jgi:hypothetical protein